MGTSQDACSRLYDAAMVIGLMPDAAEVVSLTCAITFNDPQVVLGS